MSSEGYAEQYHRCVDEVSVNDFYDFSGGPVTVEVDPITGGLEFPGIASLTLDPGLIMLALTKAEPDRFFNYTLQYPILRTGELVGQTQIYVDWINFNRIWDQCVKIL